MREKLTQERLKEVLNYDPDTGVFIWRVRLNNNGPAIGESAGSVTARGYRLIAVDGRQYRAHRLAWLYAFGTGLEQTFDHRDGDTLNNAITNLRPCSQSENLQNTKLPKSNKSGLMGVCLCRQTGKWMAQIHVDYMRIWLGRHSTKEEAHQAYLAAKAKLHTFQPTPRQA